MSYMRNSFVKRLQETMGCLRNALLSTQCSQASVWMQFIEKCRENNFTDDDICFEMKRLQFHVDDFYGVAKLLYEKCPISIKCLLADKAVGEAYSSIWRESKVG